MTQWVNPQQAEEAVGISRNHIRKLLRDYKVKGRKVNGQWLVDLASLQDYADRAAIGLLRPELGDRDEMERLYEELGSHEAVAKFLGCSKFTVWQAMKNLDIGAKTRGQSATPRFRAQPVSPERWADMFILFKQRGLRPPTMEEMCPPNCPGREHCLDKEGRCVLAEVTR